MNASLKSLRAAFAFLFLTGCATHMRDFIPNGAGQNLPPTNPAHIQALDSVPGSSMVIGVVIVDRSKAGNTEDIIAQAKQKAAAAGGDFVVWEDSEGTAPGAAAEPETPHGPASPGHDASNFGHTGPDAPADTNLLFHSNTPKARFTVGIFLQNAPAH